MAGSPLFRTRSDDYGPSYKDHLLEQYKLFVASADAISERRTSANNYFLTVNSTLVAVYGLAAALAPTAAWRVLVPVAGLFVSYSWWLLIRNYRGLNAGKFQVIHEIEEQLPAALYKYEWDVLQRGVGGAYKPLSHIEQWIPGVFGALYALLLILAACS